MIIDGIKYLESYSRQNQDNRPKNNILKVVFVLSAN